MDQIITVFMLSSTVSNEHLLAKRLQMIDLLRLDAIQSLGQLPPPPWQNLLLIVPWQYLAQPERQAILRSLAASPTAALIIIANQLSTEDARGLMQGGLIAILDTPCSSEILEIHILHAAEELRDIRDQMDRLHAAETRLSQLTPRERDILRSLATGLSNKGVARELGVSPRTVEVHRANMIRRSGARNIAELLQMQFIINRAPLQRASPLVSPMQIIATENMVSESAASKPSDANAGAEDGADRPAHSEVGAEQRAELKEEARAETGTKLQATSPPSTTPTPMAPDAANLAHAAHLVPPSMSASFAIESSFNGRTSFPHSPPSPTPAPFARRSIYEFCSNN